MTTKAGGWIGVDFDRTLNEYDGHWRDGEIADAPIAAMVKRVQAWLDEGIEVRIVTARATGEIAAEQSFKIREWCARHIGMALDVQNGKDRDMLELWDDSAVRVERNTGRRLSASFVESDP